MFLSSMARNVARAPRTSRRASRRVSNRSFRPRVEMLEGRLCLSAVTYSDGSLDTTFNGTGMATTGFGLANDVADSVAVQADGKIVVAGYSDNGQHFALARYNADGTLDASFGGTGKVTTDFGSASAVAKGVALQADGKIVAAGYAGSGYSSTYFALARYNVDGSLDASFGGTGKVITSLGSASANCVAVQADGKIVAAGGGYADSYIALARYNADGSLDASFGGTGKVTAVFDSGAGSAYDMVVQLDGKIVITGDSTYFGGGRAHNFALARFNVDGGFDTSFGGTGKVVTSFVNYETATSVTLQADGKIVAAGYMGSEGAFDFAVARYNTDGSLDTSFDSDGKQTTDFGARDTAAGVAVQGDGKIVVAGDTGGVGDHFALARYNPDGSLDAGFDGDGKVTTDFGFNSGAYGVVVQGDGKIVAAGYAGNAVGNADFAVARYGTQVDSVAIDIQAHDASYTGSPYLTSNITTTLTPADAVGTITYSFFSDAAGTTSIADPALAGAYYVQAHFASSDSAKWTNADSAIVGFTINPATLTGLASTQDALNYGAKQGSFVIDIKGVTGLAPGDSLSNILSGASVILVDAANDSVSYYEAAAVTWISDTEFTISYSLKNNMDLAGFFRSVDGDDGKLSTSAANAATDQVFAEITFDNYSLDVEFATRLFSTAK